MNLEKQQACRKAFEKWFDAAGESGESLRTVMEDSRRRYRMQLSESEEQKKNKKLSALPSTKSRGIVDSIADSFLSEYHQEPDSISFSARTFRPAQPGVPTNDELARWLTELFHYRSEYTADFYQWHDKSIRAGLVDGMEAAMVCWKKESYTKVTGTKEVLSDGTNDLELDPSALQMAKLYYPESIKEVDVESEIVVCDTWWVDQLIPGDTVFFDPAIPRLDVNLGNFVIVRLMWTPEQVREKIRQGVFDKAKEKDVEDFIGITAESESPTETAFGDPLKEKDDETQRIEVWACFYKEGAQKMVCYSVAGKKELSSPHDVNDIYFGGRLVNRYPVVVGISRAMIHENAGAGIPYLIGSHEDEWNTNRNDAMDASRQSLMNKWRVSKGADVDIDQLINKPAFYADQGEVERVDMRLDVSQVQRGMDQIQQEIVELTPTSIANRGRSIVPKGTNSTLGAAQMMEMDSLVKKNAQLKLRNETFLKPLLYLIAEMTFAYESDDTIARVAGRRAKVSVPEYPDMGANEMRVDFSLLDFPVDVSINAGLGNVPKYQKAQNLMQIAGWRRENQIPTDALAIAQQLNVLAGFDRDQFTIEPAPPPPPEVEYKLTVDMPAMMLPPEAQAVLLDKLMNGQMSVAGKVTSEDPMLNLMKQNGGMGAPAMRADAPVQNATGQEALGMSMGGQGGMNGIA